MKSIYTMVKCFVAPALLATSTLIFVSSTNKEMARRPPKLTVHDLKFIEKNLAFIPAGSFYSAAASKGDQHRYVGDGEEAPGKTISVESFYMFKLEVSNGFYMDFVNDLLLQKEVEKYSKALPDTLVWRQPLAFNEKYVDYYFRHPAYRDYPLVGVTYEQCEMFCSWLTDKYNADPKRKFKKVVFMLPDGAQRIYAANGGLSNAVFPWGGPYMRNAKGEFLANFVIVDQAGVMRHTIEDKEYLIATRRDYPAIAGSLNDYADITAPVTSFNPNGYGLYNMAGNVEEFVHEKGKTMGGSWKDPGYYLQNHVSETYDINHQANSERGFRFIMKVVEQ